MTAHPQRLLENVNEGCCCISVNVQLVDCAVNVHFILFTEFVAITLYWTILWHQLITLLMKLISLILHCAALEVLSFMIFLFSVVVVV